MEEANFLARFAKDVTVIHRRSSFRASKIMVERAKANPKISFRLDTQVLRWLGDEVKGTLSGVEVEDCQSGAVGTVPCAGAFIAIGHRPNIEFMKGQVELDAKGYILCREGSRMTSVPGVFACGDVVDSRYKQAITAAGSGCQAALDAEKWLEEYDSHLQ
jgi:thioredoxin reductase (NADPH)